MNAARPWFPNLNGIRGVACLMVFFAHVWDYLNNRSAMHPAESWLYAHFINGLGTTGVCLFFVLSGFLITRLLLHEKESTGRISLGNFYLRRVRRIWPVFFLVVAAGLFIVPLLTGHFNATETGRHLPWYLLFANNFDRLHTGFTGFGNDSLGVLWSIAVEEQFYLLWPLVVMRASRQWFPIVSALIFGVSIVFRHFNAYDTDVITFHTFSVMGDLAIGSLLAWSTLYGPRILTPWGRVANYVFLCVVVALHQPLLHNPEFATFGRALLTLGFAFLIEDQVLYAGGRFRFSSARLLSRFGVVTYGVYCYHLFVIMGLQKLNVMLGWESIGAGVFFVELLGVFLLTLGVAVVSYRVMERPLLGGKG
ncbi:MAG: acyltransferase [Bacteroidia bacterium]|jgi:peptidoglycan/LPS O-acetylase OafA/YrhL|nr:acyltransferase [Bacteroidia bacterium]